MAFYARLPRFRSVLLSDHELDEDLRVVGLRRRRMLDEHGAWVEAVPAPP